MSERKWVPEHLVDEAFPTPLPSPSDWIVGPAGDVWLISAGDEAEMYPEDIEACRRCLRPGETLDFLWTDQDLGSFEVLIHPGGSYEVKGTVPPTATHFMTGNDPDTVAGDLPTFCQCLFDNIGNRLHPQRVTVQAYAWAAEGITHRLVITAAGPRFEPVDGGNA